LSLIEEPDVDLPNRRTQLDRITAAVQLAGLYFRAQWRDV
jgi:hypothetical protein